MIELCNIQDITDGEGRNFRHKALRIIVIRQGEQVFVYENSCPHLNLPLERTEHQFLTHDNDMIQCSTHGALFTVNDGECISGPYHGQHLRALPFTIEQQKIVITAE